MIVSQDRERGRISLSTKKLEPTPGDMLRNPALVYESVSFVNAFSSLVRFAAFDLHTKRNTHKVYMHKLYTHNLQHKKEPKIWSELKWTCDFQAEEMAQTFRQRIAQAEAAARAEEQRLNQEVRY